MIERGIREKEVTWIIGKKRLLSPIVAPDQAARPGYYVCIVCGYDESQAAKFPSHEE
jgi:hypothetical protein